VMWDLDLGWDLEEILDQRVGRESKENELRNMKWVYSGLFSCVVRPHYILLLLGWTTVAICPCELNLLCMT